MVDQDKDTVITPLKVNVEEGEKTTRFGVKRKDFLKLGLLSFSAISLLAGGLWLFNYLSRNPIRVTSVLVEKAMPEPQITWLPDQSPSSQPQQGAEVTRIVHEKKEAEQKLAHFLQAKKELEAKGVAEWGGELYDRATQLSKAGDAFFMNEEYGAASEKYGEAIALLNGLRDGTDDVLRRTVNEGQRALDEGDGDRAQRLFRTVLMIDPENTVARHNLERAKNLEAVMSLIASGERHEEDNNLAFAHTDYQKAVELDPESQKALLALKRVKSIIADEQFQQLMSLGFAALDSKDYEEARSLFLKAQSFRMGSPEVNDALAQVDAAILLVRAEALRNEALAAEASENWEHSLRVYQEVLKMDNSIQFAIQGEERSRKRYLIENRMNYYLRKPEVLELDHYLEKAIKLVNEAEEVEPKGPRFSSQFKTLVDLVASAQIPVAVILESDSMTDVVIYKVGQLGRFDNRELNLRPGSYTILGTRNGYKDVRLEVSVKAVKSPIHVIVKCTEKI